MRFVVAQIVAAVTLTGAILAGIFGLIYQVPAGHANEPLYAVIPWVAALSLVLGAVGWAVLLWLWAKQAQSKAAGRTRKVADAVLAVARTLRRIRLVLVPEGNEPGATSDSDPPPPVQVRKWGQGDVEVVSPAVEDGPATLSEPTYKGTAMMAHYVVELTKVQKEAEKYRDDDPALGLSYKCPSCDHRTYTVQGAVAMLNHIRAKHGPVSASPVREHEGTPYRPDLDEAPRERFEIELAAYCDDRRKLLNRGTELRTYLLAVAPNAKQDSDWQTRQLRPWVAWFQRHEQKWPEKSRLKGLGEMPKMTPYWAAKDLRLVEPRLAWLRAHGTRCDE
jgi:hypothetical protein